VLLLNSGSKGVHLLLHKQVSASEAEVLPNPCGGHEVAYLGGVPHHSKKKKESL
jgi:hypothetical protein